MDDTAEDRKLENVGQSGKAGGHRDEGLQNGIVPPRQTSHTNGFPEQPRPVAPRHHVSAMEQMVVNWHQLNGEMQRNGELPSWNGPESREAERRTTPKRSVNGVSANDRRPDGRSMKRRTPSEGNEDMTPGMWQHFTQQGGVGEARPWGAGRSRQDGMDRYFNDNAHLLENLDNNPNIPNGIINEDEGFDRAMVQSDESEDDAFVNENEEDAMQVVMTKKFSTSSEDLGDFIETDISLPNQGSSSYANSLNSSTEDLARGENCMARRDESKDDVPEKDLKRPVSLFVTRAQRNHFAANISNIPLQTSKVEPPGSALNSDSSSSNYFSPEGDIEDFDMESNPSHVDPDSVRNSTECLHDKGNNNGALGEACNQLECSTHWKMSEKNVCAVKLLKSSRSGGPIDSCNMEVAMLDLGLQDSRGHGDSCDNESGAAGGEPSCVNNLDYDRAQVANLTARQSYNLSRHTSTSNCETDENSTQDDMELNQLSSPNSENNDSDVYDSFVSNVNADSFAHFRDFLEPCPPASRSKSGPKMWANRSGYDRHSKSNGAGLNIGAHSHANLTSQSSTSDDDSPGIPVKPTQYSDDDSPSSALRLLDYEFLDTGNNLPLWSRHQHNTDDSSPDAENCTSCQNSATLKRHDKDVELKARNVGRSHDLIAAAAELNVDITGIPGLDRSMINMLAAEGHSLQARQMEQCSHNGDHRRVQSEEDRAMIWCEYQAFLLQVKQIGASACGATAIINVLKAFDMYEDPERVMEVVSTNLRAEDAPVPEYLLSRSVAGTTAECLIEGIKELTGGAICGKFFPTWPVKNFNLSKWLCKWIKNGAVPLLTLNLQRGGPLPWVNGVTDNIRSESRPWQKVRDRGNEILIPDAWHHQMCYGVGPKGVYLTNPLEVVPPSQLWEQLCSASELLIRRQDIVSRWDQDTDLSILLSQTDPRWRTMNVLGQVVNVIREEAMRSLPGCQPPVTSHIRIPAWYKAGITLYIRKDSQVYETLMEESELPDQEDSPVAGGVSNSLGAIHVSPPSRNDLFVIKELSTSDDSNLLERTLDEDSVENLGGQNLERDGVHQSDRTEASDCRCRENSEQPQNGSIPWRCSCVYNRPSGSGSLTERNDTNNSDFNPMEGTSSRLGAVDFYDTGQMGQLVRGLSTSQNGSRANQQPNCDAGQRILHDNSRDTQTVAMEMNGVALDADNVAMDTGNASMDSNSESGSVATGNAENQSEHSSFDGGYSPDSPDVIDQNCCPWQSRP